MTHTSNSQTKEGLEQGVVEPACSNASSQNHSLQQQQSVAI
jgi:hypothetical protein